MPVAKPTFRSRYTLTLYSNAHIPFTEYSGGSMDTVSSTKVLTSLQLVLCRVAAVKRLAVHQP